MPLTRSQRYNSVKRLRTPKRGRAPILSTSGLRMLVFSSYDIHSFFTKLYCVEKTQYFKPVQRALIYCTPFLNLKRDSLTKFGRPGVYAAKSTSKRSAQLHHLLDSHTRGQVPVTVSTHCFLGEPRSHSLCFCRCHHKPLSPNVFPSRDFSVLFIHSEWALSMSQVLPQFWRLAPDPATVRFDVKKKLDQDIERNHLHHRQAAAQEPTVSLAIFTSLFS